MVFGFNTHSYTYEEELEVHTMQIVRPSQAVNILATQQLTAIIASADRSAKTLLYSCIVDGNGLVWLDCNSAVLHKRLTGHVSRSASVAPRLRTPLVRLR